MRRAQLSGKVGAGLDPVRRDPGGLRSRRRRRSARSSSRSGVGATQRALANAARPSRARRSKESSNTGSARWARCRWRRPDRVARPAGQRLAALPDAGLPPVGAQRLLPVGRRLRLPRPAAGRHGAGPRRAAASRASSCCAARRTSSAKATCSTGGIRRRAAACARTARTTTSGCRTPRPATWRAPAIPACWTRRSSSSTAARSTPRTSPTTTCRRARAKRASLYEHCVRAIEHGAALRRARPAADRLRRLERRHEPGRRERQGRKRLAGLLPL